VPDTTLLPPPPSFFDGFDFSPTNNATEDEAAAGEAWCREFPLYSAAPARTPSDAAALAAAVSQGHISVFAPPHYKGTVAPAGPGVWRGKSSSHCRDSCLTTWPPLYRAGEHNPAATGGARKTIYYEVRVLGDSRRDEVSLAIGFAAPPYPAFRLPGWHRGSAAVHGDDGHRYVNDVGGGRALTRPFARGQTVGFGMAFGPGAGGKGVAVDVFLTRDGVEDARWNLHEETDAVHDLPVTGLEGYHDLCAAVGVFKAVSFEIVFDPARWLWKGGKGGF
jgi:hypothetical protein